jgi:hypothetical protein
LLTASFRKIPPTEVSQPGALRVKHYSIRTETQNLQWSRRFILFHDKRHPRDMGAAEVEAFLTHLAVAGRPCRCVDDDDLYPRIEQGRTRGGVAARRRSTPLDAV